MNIKPIETIYKGYKFRSRLEARWAVFFDYMGFNWKYEHEGYVLEDGTYYLPDFLIILPEFYEYEGKYYIEVKPFKFTKEEKRKAELFGKEYPIILLSGEPSVIYYDMITPSHKYSAEEIQFTEEDFDSHDDYLDYLEHMKQEFVYKTIILFPYKSSWFTPYYYDSDERKAGDAIDKYSYNFTNIDDIEFSCLKAKQARFEHGQSG